MNCLLYALKIEATKQDHRVGQPRDRLLKHRVISSSPTTRKPKTKVSENSEIHGFAFVRVWEAAVAGQHCIRTAGACSTRSAGEAPIPIMSFSTIKLLPFFIPSLYFAFSLEVLSNHVSSHQVALQH